MLTSTSVALHMWMRMHKSGRAGARTQQCPSIAQAGPSAPPCESESGVPAGMGFDCETPEILPIVPLAGQLPRRRPTPSEQSHGDRSPMAEPCPGAPCGRTSTCKPFAGQWKSHRECYHQRDHSVVSDLRTHRSTGLDPMGGLTKCPPTSCSQRMTVLCAMVSG